MKNINKKFPKKAMLITNGGFKRIIDIEKSPDTIDFPFAMKAQLNAPELYGISIYISSIAKFRLEKVNKKHAVYRQFDAVTEIKS